MAYILKTRFVMGLPEEAAQNFFAFLDSFVVVEFIESLALLIIDW